MSDEGMSEEGARFMEEIRERQRLAKEKFDARQVAIVWMVIGFLIACCVFGTLR